MVGTTSSNTCCILMELTGEVYQFLSNCMKERTNSADFSCHFLAVDLDPVLTSRARESNLHGDNITYECVDAVGDDARDKAFADYLGRMGRDRFDVAFCFSVTMWVHLNHGDEGLQLFLEGLARWADTLVIEPQPWKCYRAAVRRLGRHGACFPHYESIARRDTLTTIGTLLTEHCHFAEVFRSDPSLWGRTIIIYQKLNC
ncbi:pre-miRNA 5'-monophosphate methyltransferase isoform X2 [Bacillus rossius redtenbacheri]|uniref:pre-miRNA 5'-monophosphate methyltransferase isoform X2 n=1 Tax=Bacillus rossius redtenbacheri TaxID=93214 RepID=UPI002FDEA329